MINNNTPLLAAFGISMGFSADDMHDMIIDVYASVSENENVSPLDDVARVVAGMDSKTLWTGAMLYGYIIDAYKDIDVSDIDVSDIDDIYTRALHKWGVGLQIDVFIEEAAEAIQAVQHHRRGRCDMDTVCGELSDLQVMLEQMKIVYGTDRFERIFAEKIYALDEKLSECEKGL